MFLHPVNFPSGWMRDGATSCWVVRNSSLLSYLGLRLVSLSQHGQPSPGQMRPSALQGLLSGSGCCCCCPPASNRGWACRGAEASGMAVGHGEVNVWGEDSCRWGHLFTHTCTHPAGWVVWKGRGARGHPAGLGTAQREWQSSSWRVG